MKTDLDPYQKAAIKNSVLNGNFSAEYELGQLIKDGYDESTAKNLLLQILKECRFEIFKNKLQQQKNEEKKKLSYFVSMIAAITGPLFSVGNVLWYVIAFSIAAIAGYYSNVNKPIAGIAASVLLAVLFPLTYGLYMSGRASFFSIELVIPLLMAIIPAYLLQLLVAKLFYSADELNLD